MCCGKQRFNRWPSPVEDFRTWVIRVSPEHIGFISATFEAYDGVATVRTRDSAIGALDLWIMPGQTNVVESILKDFEREFQILHIREEKGHPILSS